VYGHTEVPVRTDLVGGSAIASDQSISFASGAPTIKRGSYWSNGGTLYITVNGQSLRVPGASSIMLETSAQYSAISVQSASGSPGKLYYMVEW